MGVSQSNPPRITKLQVEIAAMKVREYLNLQKERKSNEVIKDEKQLVTLINGEVRNKHEELLTMERIVNTLKYLNGSPSITQPAASSSATQTFSRTVPP